MHASKIIFYSYRVCEHIHEQRQDWVKVFECYVNDSSRHGDIFQFLRHIFNQPSAAPQFLQLKQAILRHIKLLVELNAATLAAFLATDKPELVPQALDALTQFSREKYQFLEAVIELT